MKSCTRQQRHRTFLTRNSPRLSFLVFDSEGEFPPTLRLELGEAEVSGGGAGEERRGEGEEDVPEDVWLNPAQAQAEAQAEQVGTGQLGRQDSDRTRSLSCSSCSGWSLIMMASGQPAGVRCGVRV
eukprot:3931072-Rhodomonas_salina.1